jgi:CHAD domain-containing protein
MPKTIKTDESSTKKQRRVKLPSPFIPEMSIAESARCILLDQFTVAQRHENDLRQKYDEESVHQMRVAYRQIRSVYHLLGDYLPHAYRHDNYTKTIKRTARRLGAVRDLDVLLKSLKSDNASDSIRKPIQRKHHKKLAALLKWLDDKDYQVFISAFHALIEQSIPLPTATHNDHRPYQIGQILPHLIYAQLGVIRGYETVFDNASITTLHELRIQCKHFRYLLEFFKSVLGEDIQPVITALKSLQDALGKLNDDYVALQILEPLKASTDEKKQATIAPDLKQVLATYRETRLAHIQIDNATIKTAWEAFNTSEMRQFIAKAVARL